MTPEQRKAALANATQSGPKNFSHYMKMNATTREDLLAALDELDRKDRKIARLSRRIQAMEVEELER